MSTVASLQVEIGADTSGVERGVNQANALLGHLKTSAGAASGSLNAFGGASRSAGGAMQQFGMAAAVSGAKSAALHASIAQLSGSTTAAGASAARSSPSFLQLSAAMAAGQIAAHALIGVAQGVVGGLINMGKGALDLSSRLEQAKIGFTTMLGGAQQADAFIRKLQAFAESTPFSFPGIQQVAQSFMAMGVEAKNVIPIVTDVSNALAAAGHGGDTDALVRVGASLSEIAAQGKVTAEQLRELSRNGIAVMPMLADAMHTTTAEVRQLAEDGKISATQFFEAFHSQVAQRYGDIQAEQAKTWAVAISNVGDILGRLTTETLSEFFGMLTKGALLLQDFLRSDTAQQWAADFKASIHEVMAALAPFGASLQAAMGGGSTDLGKLHGPTPAEITKAMAVPKEVTASAQDYKVQLGDAKAEIHGITAALTGVKDQQDAVGASIDAVNKHYELQQRGLKDQQDANAAAIDATKAKYEAILAPLERARDQLGRLAEDTKADFANILDPLKAGLEQTNRQIEDAKDGYEAITKPIERQIAAINKANSALQKQRQLEAQIADIALRKQIMAAGGDSAARGEIARRMKLNEFAQEELGFQVDLLEMNNKKGRNDKQLEALQKQANGLRAEEIGLQRQGLGLIDKSATAEIEKQKIINDAAKERGAIAQAEADIAADAAKAPLETQLETLKTQLASVLDPLEAQQKSFARAIQEATAAEAAALKPIADAQTEVARTIADVTQSQKDALAPLEEQQKAIAAQIKESEAAQRAALEPLKEQQAALEAQSKEMENHKRQITDQIAAWKDTTAAIKEAAAEAVKVAPGLDLTAGAAESVPVAPFVGKSMIPAGMIEDFKGLATNVQASADAFNNLNASMDAAGVPFANVAEAVGKFAIVTVAVGWLRNLALAVTSGGLAATLTNPLWAAWGLFVVAQIDTVRKEWEATDWNKMGQDWNNWLAGMGIAFGIWEVERTAAWNAFWAGLAKTKDAWWTDFKADQIAQHAATSAAWTEFTGGISKTFGDAWNGLKGLAEAGWKTFIDFLTPALAGAAALFDPVVKAIDAVGTAIRGLPVQLPDWMRYILPGLPTGGRPASGGANGFAGGVQGVVPGGTGQTTSAGTHGGHPAIDIFAAKGTPIHAPVGGTSTPAYYSLGGNATIIAGDDGKFYYFAHGNVPFVPGRISAGQQIGQVGDTGNAAGTSPHLHAAVASTAELFNLLNGSGDFDPVEVFNRVASAAGGMGTIVEQAGAKAAAGLTTIMAPIRAAGVGMAQSLAQGIGQGDTVVSGAVEAIVNEAIKQGMDPLIALALAKAESGFDPKARGDSGKSVGLYQLRDPGQGSGMTVAQKEDPATNANKFLAAHKALYAQLVAEGHVGEDLAATFGRIAEGSDPQYAYRYADAYRALVAQFGTTRSAALVTGQAQNTLGQDLQYNAQWVADMATQQANLATVLQGQVDPATIQTTAAMKNMSAVIGPIERQVAAGSISFDTYQFKMVDLARATGLATKPWDQYSSGLISVNQAMANVISQSADAGPQFEALRQKMVANGGVTEQMALDYFQLVKNYGLVAPAAATAAAATTTATTATTGLNGAVGTVNNTLDPAQYTAVTSAVNDMTGGLGGAKSAFGEMGQAAAGAHELLSAFDSAAHSLGDYLEGHTFDFHVNLPDLPDWAIPGSPMPLETGFRGVADALDTLNRISSASLRSLEMPSAAAAVRAVAEGGGSGGGTISIGSLTVTTQAKDAKEMAEDLRSELIKIARKNGGASRLFE